MSDTSSIRVLFLSDHLGYGQSVYHGATTYFLQVLPALHDATSLTVCFLRNRHDAAGPREAVGIEPRFLNRAKWDPRALRDLVHLIRRQRIDLIHAAGVKGMLLGQADPAYRTSASVRYRLAFRTLDNQ